MTENAFAMEYKPSLAERLWRALGWQPHHADLPETPEVEAMPGWAMTTICIEFSLIDRLRLLLTGRLRLDVRQAMDARVNEVVSASSHEILPPGKPFRE